MAGPLPQHQYCKTTGQKHEEVLDELAEDAYPADGFGLPPPPNVLPPPPAPVAAPLRVAPPAAAKPTSDSTTAVMTLGGGLICCMLFIIGVVVLSVTLKRPPWQWLGNKTSSERR